MNHISNNIVHQGNENCKHCFKLKREIELLKNLPYSSFIKESGGLDMKLKNFSVTNFRSITKAHRVKMSDTTTILVGKNNEGKSNLLKALSLAMSVMEVYGSNPQLLNNYLRLRNSEYKWERDFPLSLQEQGKKQSTIVDLVFELSAEEKRMLKDSIGVSISESIPIRVTFTLPTPTVSVPKKGSPAFKEHSSELSAFVCKRIVFNYIPTIRTEERSMEAISDIIEQEIQKLEGDDEYRNALDTIERKRSDVYVDVATRIETALRVFLPDIRKVSIEAHAFSYRPHMRYGPSIIIDDGNATSIEMKGDGIKSLSALALLSGRKEEGKASIIAIEEPESHLHPEAIHQLNETILAMSENSQVILSTHNPAFINKHDISCNIIVDHGKAEPAKSIKQIRDILGVIASDNLIHANAVLVVEGSEDRIALSKLLPKQSEKIKTALSNGTLIIDEIGGAGNLPYKLQTFRNIACQYHVLLDNDPAGKASYDAAVARNLLSMKSVTFTNCKGRSESEFEDCLLPKVYKKAILEDYGVDLSTKEFKTKHKWSDRVKACFQAQGKLWNDNIEKQIKETVANLMTGDKEKEVSKADSFLDSLVRAIEEIV